MEYIDILDKKGNKLNTTKSYDEVHETGLTHRTVHIWIINSKKEILLQKRNKNRRAYPNLWDISAAGHVSAGETSVEAAKKETNEELGLDLDISSFIFITTLEEHIVLNNGSYVNNEFQDIYIVHNDIPISDLKIGLDEVEEVKWVTVSEFQSMNELLVPHAEEHAILLEYISKIN